MGVRLILLSWFVAAVVAAQSPFQLQLLGVDPATQKIVIINVDTRSITIDRTSGNPVLSCALPGFQQGAGILLDRRTSPPTLSALLNQISPPSVTSKAVFSLNPDTNTWNAAVFFSATPPNLMDLVQVFRNGAFVYGDIAGISYAAPATGSPNGTPGTLSITPLSAWPSTDRVTAVWVFPMQSLFLTPPPK